MYTVNKLAPITLNCGHSFCRNCVNQLGKDKDFISCVICSSKTWTPLKNLTKNYQMLGKFIFYYFIFYLEILEKYKLLDKDPVVSVFDLKAPSISDKLEKGLGSSSKQGFDIHNQVGTATQRTLGRFPGVDTEIELDEGSDQVLTGIRESTEIIRANLDELTEISKKVTGIV